jgi:hypothetical protein
MPPSNVSKSQIRNEKRKRARQLLSVSSSIQKIHTSQLQHDLLDKCKELSKTKIELSSANLNINRLQHTAQSATLDAFIATRTVENFASKIADRDRQISEKDRMIASLTSASASSLPQVPAELGH